MHSINAAYCYRRSGVVCLCVCVLVTTVRAAKTYEATEVSFDADSCYLSDAAAPGKY